MSHLENKLKASSEREREWVPPPGQWAAIRQQLAADKPVAKPRTPIWPLTVLLLLVVGVAVAISLRKASFSEIPMVNTEASYVERPSVALQEAETSPTTREQTTVADSPQIIKGTEIEAPEVTSNAGIKERKSERTPDSVSGIPPKNEAIERLHKEAGNEANHSMVSRQQDEHPDLPTVGNNPEYAGIAGTDSAAISLDPDKAQRADDKPLLRPLPPLARLEVDNSIPAIPVVDNLTAGLDAGIQPLRKPAPSFWYFQASAHAINRPPQADFRFYQTSANAFDPVAIPLDGGQEWLELYPAFGAPEFKRGVRWDQIYGGTVGRQFRSGFDLSIGFSIYREQDVRERLTGSIPYEPGKAYTLRTEHLNSIQGRVDIRYMFRRRHPFKFYFGVSILGGFVDENRLETRFYFPERGIDQVITKQAYIGRDIFYNVFPFPRGGFLYQVSPNWQVGLDMLLHFPGLQVQYQFR